MQRFARSCFAEVCTLADSNCRSYQLLLHGKSAAMTWLLRVMFSPAREIGTLYCGIKRIERFSMIEVFYLLPLLVAEFFLIVLLGNVVVAACWITAWKLLMWLRQWLPRVVFILKVLLTVLTPYSRRCYPVTWFPRARAPVRRRTLPFHPSWRAWKNKNLWRHPPSCPPLISYVQAYPPCVVQPHGRRRQQLGRLTEM